MRRNSPSSQESHLGLFKLASPEVGARKVLQHLDIGVLVELLQAVLVHLRETPEIRVGIYTSKTEPELQRCIAVVQHICVRC